VSVLDEARTPYGTRRFYPPGQHPATARLRAELAHLKKLQDTTLLGLLGEPSELEKAIDWMERQLAVFEAGEDRAKRDYIKRARKPV
jgi:hypothetical protein